jgi:DNA-binding MarR family transcriptional regulator
MKQPLAKSLRQLSQSGWIGVLPGMEVRVLFALASSSDPATSESVESLETIANCIGMTMRNVERAMANLVARGLVVATENEGGRGRPAHRFICVPPGPAPARKLSFSARRTPPSEVAYG